MAGSFRDSEGADNGPNPDTIANLRPGVEVPPIADEWNGGRKHPYGRDIPTPRCDRIDTAHPLRCCVCSFRGFAHSAIEDPYVIISAQTARSRIDFSGRAGIALLTLPKRASIRRTRQPRLPVFKSGVPTSFVAARSTLALCISATTRPEHPFPDHA